MPLSLSFPIHNAGKACLPELLLGTCWSHSKCSINRRFTIFQEAQNQQLLPPHCLPGPENGSAALAERKGPPLEAITSPRPLLSYPPLLVAQVTILLSVELTPSEVVMSLIQGTKLENAAYSITRSGSTHTHVKPTGHLGGGRASWGGSPSSCRQSEMARGFQRGLRWDHNPLSPVVCWR